MSSFLYSEMYFLLSGYFTHLCNTRYLAARKGNIWYVIRLFAVEMHSYALVEKHEVANGILMRLNGNMIKLRCIYIRIYHVHFIQKNRKNVFTFSCSNFLQVSKDTE